MKAHTKVYYNHFKYDISEFIECEVCGKRAVDIHHIKARGMGGTKQPDTIENLMALCRACHEKYGDKKQWRDYLTAVHQLKLGII